MVFKSIVLFFIGFLSCVILVFIVSFSLDISFLTGLVTLETSTPLDRITEENIFLYDNEIILKIPNATISNYASTGSMKPIFDKGASGIRITPKSSNDIEVGDIVSFRYNENLIVHRVIKKGIDERGVYFITKGDSSLTKEKIRFEDIEYITIGILW